jgi:hypothetical protein
VKAKATERVMAMVTRVASNDKGDANGDEGGGCVTAVRAMVAAMIVVGKDEGNGDGNEGGGWQRG